MLSESLKNVGSSALDRKNLPLPIYTLFSLLQECSKKNANISTCRWVFSLLVASGLDWNAFLGDHAIRMFASCGSLEEAKQAFYKVADKSVYTWNALISAHAKLGQGNKALEQFHHMLEDGVEPDKFVISCLLKICGDLEVLYKARLMHHHMAYTGLSSDVVLGNSLLYAYAKCGELCDMWDVFCALRVQDLVSWSTVFMGYVNNGHGFHALELYEKMKHDGIRPDKVVFLAVLKASIGDDKGNAILSISNGFILHDEVIQNGLESDTYVGSSLLDMYSKCGQVKEASKVFGKLSYPNVVCWNAMISCFAQHGDGNSALKLYLRMQEEGIRPDKVIFLSILKACSCIRDAGIARLIHGEIQETEFDLDIMVGSAVIDTYAKCAYIEDAQGVFDRLMNGDSVVWGTMMSGYTHNGRHANTLQLYQRMCEEGIVISITAYLSALKACCSIGHFDKAMILHDKLIRSAYESDDGVGSCLIDMYSKFGCLSESQKVFGNMLCRNKVSCGAMMAGFADNGRGGFVLSLLREMDISGVIVDRIVLLYVLKACASMGSLDYARCVHHRVVESEFHLDVVLGNGLIEMYVNCWSLEEARTVFETMPERDIVSWGSIISGYAQSSDDCSLVEHCLKTMRALGLEPNETIFSSLLSACSHNRVLKAGCYYFTLMRDEYNVSPSVEHYSCMIDLLGHTGSLLEAEDLLETMPVSPNAIVCTTLLNSCRAYGNSSISEQCFDQFVERDVHQCI